jgi:hypothetical protein
VTSVPPKNLAHSVRDRLLKLAKARGEDFNFVLVRYALERLLYRLSNWMRNGSQITSEYRRNGAQRTRTAASVINKCRRLRWFAIAEDERTRFGFRYRQGVGVSSPSS